MQKVIEMLNGMASTAKEEKKAEEVAFAKYSAWCKSETAETSQDIQTAGGSLERLGSEIGKLAADVEALASAMTTQQENIDQFEADLKKEKAQREKDSAAFQETEKDLADSLDALERALSIVEAQSYDRPAAEVALLQVSSSSALPDDARALVNSFLSLMDKSDDDEAHSTEDAPEADAYESQSGGIVGLLSNLRDEFKSNLGKAQKEEMNAAHAFAMISMDLTDSIENTHRDVDDKIKVKESKVARKAEAAKQHESTKLSQAADQEKLAEVSSECEGKSASFEEKQKLRTEEIEAIEKAIEIMSGKVAGSAEKHLSLLQGADGSALLQTQASSTAKARAMGIRRRVRDFITSESRRLKSKTLSLLVEKMEADPFGKVKEMIDGMITRLMEEAKQDAEHEGFCDAEMGKSKVTRIRLSEDIDALTAAIEGGKATILELTDSTAELSKELSEMGAAVDEASRIRAEEKAKNEATIKDAQEAQGAVDSATAVLKDFYTKAMQATALVQSDAQPGQRHLSLAAGIIKMGSDEWHALANPSVEGTVDKGHKQGQQTFGEVHRGQQDRAGGVLAMLEVIKSEFANLEADTSSAEVTAAKGYERFLAENQKSKSVKEKKVEQNEADRVAAEAKVQQDTGDLKAAQDELLSAESYHEKLVPQCVDQGQSWEERVAARQAEIDSLKEALKIFTS